MPAKLGIFCLAHRLTPSAVQVSQVEDTLAEGQNMAYVPPYAPGSARVPIFVRIKECP